MANRGKTTDSKSASEESQAGSAVRGAAAGGTAETVSSGADTAASGAGYQSSGAEVTSDVGQAEAYIAGNLALSRQWDTNQKHLFDLTLQNAQSLFQDSRAVATRMQAVAEQAVMDNQAAARNIQSIAQSEREETLRIGKLAGDRIWNINETDAFAVLLNKVVGDAVDRKMADALKRFKLVGHLVDVYPSHWLIHQLITKT